MTVLDLATLPSIRYSDKGRMPKVPAVYIVIGLRNKVLYVGQTVNLRRRMSEHHRNQEFKELNAQSVAWMAVRDRGTAEYDLINSLRPLLNRTVPVKPTRFISNSSAQDTQAIVILFDKTLLQKVDDFRFKDRCPSRNDAVRKLIESALRQKVKASYRLSGT
jgi:excinuclease UvrABC nuclease subunit